MKLTSSFPTRTFFDIFFCRFSLSLLTDDRFCHETLGGPNGTHLRTQFSATYGAFTTRTQTQKLMKKWHPENRRRFRIWKPSIHFLGSRVNLRSCILSIQKKCNTRSFNLEDVSFRRFFSTKNPSRFFFAVFQLFSSFPVGLGRR